MENKDNKKQDLEPETIIIEINPEENKNNNSSIRQKKIEMVSTNMNKVDNNFSGNDVIIIEKTEMMISVKVQEMIKRL